MCFGSMRHEEPIRRFARRATSHPCPGASIKDASTAARIGDLPSSVTLLPVPRSSIAIRRILSIRTLQQAVGGRLPGNGNTAAPPLRASPDRSRGVDLQSVHEAPRPLSRGTSGVGRRTRGWCACDRAHCRGDPANSWQTRGSRPLKQSDSTGPGRISGSGVSLAVEPCLALLLVIRLGLYTVRVPVPE